MGKQLEMFTPPPAPEPKGMVAELVEAHRERTRVGRARHTRARAFCPNCGAPLDVRELR